MVNRKLFYALVAGAVIAPAAALVAQNAEMKGTDDSAKEMLEVAKEAYELQMKMRERELTHASPVWSDRLLESELLVAKSADERRAARRRYLERAMEMLEVQKARHEIGAVTTLEVLDWQYRVAKAKHALAAEAD